MFPHSLFCQGELRHSTLDETLLNYSTAQLLKPVSTCPLPSSPAYWPSAAVVVAATTLALAMAQILNLALEMPLILGLAICVVLALVSCYSLGCRCGSSSVRGCGRRCVGGRAVAALALAAASTSALALAAGACGCRGAHGQRQDVKLVVKGEAPGAVAQREDQTLVEARLRVHVGLGAELRMRVLGSDWQNAGPLPLTVSSFPGAGETSGQSGRTFVE